MRVSGSSLPASPCSSRRFSSSSGLHSSTESELRCQLSPRYGRNKCSLDTSASSESQPTSPCSKRRSSASSSTTRSALSSVLHGDSTGKSFALSTADRWVTVTPPPTPRSESKEELRQVASPSRMAARSARRVTRLRQESDRILAPESVDGHVPTARPLDAGVLVASHHAHSNPKSFTSPPMVVFIVCWLLGCWVLLGGAFIRAQTLTVATDVVTATPPLNMSCPFGLQLAEDATADAPWSPSPVRFVELPPRVTGSLFGFSMYAMLTSWQ